MSILKFERILARGITHADLVYYRHSRVSGMETFAEYTSFLCNFSVVFWDKARECFARVPDRATA